MVGIHGIGQQRKGEATLHDEWAMALIDGVCLAAGTRVEYAPVTFSDLRCVAYGSIFRQPGNTLSVSDPYLSAEDATEDDTEMLCAWWRSAAEVDPYVSHPDSATLARTPVLAQAALRALSSSRFFSGIAERAMLFDLQQVRRYLTDLEVRRTIHERVEAAVTDETRVMIGHSLGSVIAYETLCAHPEWPIRTLVTLGSPLGIRNLIFDRLLPSPSRDGDGNLRASWPGNVDSWTNIADAGDVVALVKDLRPNFGNVTCQIIDNGSKAHSIGPYLTAEETGAAILAGLGD